MRVKVLMQHDNLAVLIIDDSEDDALLLQRQLSKAFASVQMTRLEDQQRLEQVLQQQTWDIILCDIKMPALDVVSVLNILKTQHIQTPLIVVSGHVAMEDAVDLMHHGATDFVRKDDHIRLIPSVERALTEVQNQREKQQAIADLHLAKEAAEHANKAKSDFLMVMNHELRTPLHGIIGMLDLLAEDTQLWQEEQRDFLQTARCSSKSLRILINDILDLTAAETGNLHINHAQFDLPACLEGALAPFLIAVNAKGLSFELQIKQLPRLVLGDEARIRQVVLNLVGNAMKFTDEGSIRLLAEMRVNGSGQECLHFSVEDTGYGISPQRLDEVFQPFVQFENTGKEQQVGTGLGTSIVKQFVEMMGGQVWVKSALGEGSCFSFEVPLQVVNAEHAAKVEYVSHRFKTGEHHILPQAPSPTVQHIATPSQQ
ncbi:MAG: ATP-binding protein, partial [Mariprofundaceae bacterium]|nr:ATP-binding protein [Mariprofundaceae bacterium]